MHAWEREREEEEEVWSKMHRPVFVTEGQTDERHGKMDGGMGGWQGEIEDDEEPESRHRWEGGKWQMDAKHVTQWPPLRQMCQSSRHTEICSVSALVFFFTFMKI